VKIAGLFGETRQRERKRAYKSGAALPRRTDAAAGHQTRRGIVSPRPPTPANPEAQYALATFYKEGTGVEKDIEKAVTAARGGFRSADNVDCRGSNMPLRLFNGTGTPKNEAARP